MVFTSVYQFGTVLNQILSSNSFWTFPVKQVLTLSEIILNFQMILVVFLFPFVQCQDRYWQYSCLSTFRRGSLKFEKGWERNTVFLVLVCLFQLMFQLKWKFLVSFPTLGASCYGPVFCNLYGGKAVAQNLRICRSTQWDCWHWHFLCPWLQFFGLFNVLMFMVTHQWI